jgi:hypothetical protein
MRVNWFGVAAVVVVSVVSLLSLGVYQQHETHFVNLQPFETRLIRHVETVRDLLRWIAFAATFVILRCVVLLCTRPPA